jgi:hypothetical protein
MNEFASEAVQVRCRAELWADRFFFFQGRFGRLYRHRPAGTEFRCSSSILVRLWNGWSRIGEALAGTDGADEDVKPGRQPKRFHDCHGRRLGESPTATDTAPKGAELTDRFRDHAFPYTPHFVAAHEH